MSRFYEDDEGIPWPLWEQIVSRALGGRRGQMALAQLEQALLDLPEKKLIEGNLATGGQVCAVGAYVARRHALEHGCDMAAAIAAISSDEMCECGHPRHEGQCTGIRWGKQCYCDEFEACHSDAFATADAGVNAGLRHSIAWQLAYMNDEDMAGASPEERYKLVLDWVRRAQGKEEAASAA